MNRKILILAIVVAVFSTKTKAQNPIGQDGSKANVINTAVPFLTIAPDSRSGGMGDAGVATSPDINSQHWNSAKYMFMEDKGGFSLTYTPWLQNLNVDDLYLVYASGFYRFDNKQAVSGSVRYFNLGEIQETNIDGPTGVTIRPNEFAIDAGYSRKFSDYISGGIVFRFIYTDIANGISNLSNPGMVSDYEAGTSYAADISAYYQREVEVSGYDAEMAFGLNISNIGTKITYSEQDSGQFIPTNLRLGGRFTFEIDDYNSVSLASDINKLLVPTPFPDDPSKNVQDYSVIEGMLKALYEAPEGEKIQEFMWSIGAEYWYREQFAVRAGYFNEHQNKGNRKYFTAGVGLVMNVVNIDFSYLIPSSGGRTNPLANTMRLTIGFKFK